MPLIATLIVTLSLALLMAWVVWQQYRWPHWSTLIANLLGLVLYVLLLRALFGFPNFDEPQSKGPQDTQFPVLVLAMYVCMTAGMAAEYFYHLFDSPPSEARRFDAGAFVKPFLVSPLVFIPLAASLQNANLDFSRFDGPRLMILLVAFENGFLWRGYFSSKLAKTAKVAQGKGR